MQPEEVKVPDAHQSLPDDVQRQWRETYAEAYADAHTEQSANGDKPNESRLQQHARQEANRVLKVKAPKTIADVAALPKWQVMSTRDAKNVITTGADGKRVVIKSALVVVTFDGKKHVIEKTAKEAQGSGSERYGKSRPDRADDKGDPSGKGGDQKPPAA